MARWTGGRRQAGREGGGDLGCRAVDGQLVQRLGPCAMVTGAGTEIPEAFTVRVPGTSFMISLSLSLLRQERGRRGWWKGPQSWGLICGELLGQGPTHS